MRLLMVFLAVGTSWTGTWSNTATGTSGSVSLSGATLRLGGMAFGCAQPVSLPVQVHGGRVDGGGRTLPCNRGLRWSISGPVGAPVVQIRLPDGSRAQLQLALQRR